MTDLQLKSTYSMVVKSGKCWIKPLHQQHAIMQNLRGAVTFD